MKGERIEADFLCSDGYRQLAAAIVLHAVWDYVAEEDWTDRFTSADYFLNGQNDLSVFLMNSLGLDPNQVYEQAQERRAELREKSRGADEKDFIEWRKEFFPSTARLLNRWRDRNATAKD